MFGSTMPTLLKRFFDNTERAEGRTQPAAEPRDDLATDAQYVARLVELFRESVTSIARVQGIAHLPSIEVARSDAAWIVRNRQTSRYFDGLALDILLESSGAITVIKETPTGRIIPMLELLGWLIFDQPGHSCDEPVMITVRGSAGTTVLTREGRTVQIPECTLLAAPYAEERANREQVRAIIELLTKGAVQLTLKGLRSAEGVDVWLHSGAWNVVIDDA